LTISPDLEHAQTDPTAHDHTTNETEEYVRNFVKDNAKMETHAHSPTRNPGKTRAKAQAPASTNQNQQAPATPNQGHQPQHHQAPELAANT